MLRKFYNSDKPDAGASWLSTVSQICNCTILRQNIKLSKRTYLSTRDFCGLGGHTGRTGGKGEIALVGLPDKPAYVCGVGNVILKSCKCLLQQQGLTTRPGGREGR